MPSILAATAPRERAVARIPFFGSLRLPRFTTALLTAASMAGCSLALLPASARADEPATVEKATYTTGSSGATHKWLPVRPGVAGDSKTIAVGYNEPVAAPAGNPAGNGTFVDPFGDQVPKTASRTAPTRAAPNGAENLTPDALSNDRLLQFPGSAGPGTSAQQSVSGEPATMRAEAATPIPSAGAQPPREEGIGEVPKSAPCPTPDSLKPIGKLTYNIRAEGGDFPDECGLGKKSFTGRAWNPTCYTWNAPSTCHKPLYFEEMQLERYGHSWGCLAQPFVSAAHFFVSVPMLPYNMGLNPPGECIYSLGYYRPGSCAPYTLDPFPLSIRAGLIEAGTVTGLVFLLP